MFKPEYNDGPSLGGFKEFVASKSPHEAYNWAISAVCACGQYSKTIGVKDWSSVSKPGTCTGIWPELNRIAHGSGAASDWTFGKLKERLELV